MHVLVGVVSFKCITAVNDLFVKVYVCSGWGKLVHYLQGRYILDYLRC